MAQAQLNQPTASRELLVKAMDVVNHSLRQEGHLEDDWNDWIIIHVLVREVATMIPAATAPTQP
jgi:hypothetical protein